jgi:hypothetical protein
VNQQVRHGGSMIPAAITNRFSFPTVSDAGLGAKSSSVTPAAYFNLRGIQMPEKKQTFSSQTRQRIDPLVECDGQDE